LVCIITSIRKAHLIFGYVSWVQNDVNQFGLYLKLSLKEVHT
jgi:hypothetical protein